MFRFDQKMFKTSWNYLKLGSAVVEETRAISRASVIEACLKEGKKKTATATDLFFIWSLTRFFNRCQNFGRLDWRHKSAVGQKIQVWRHKPVFNSNVVGLFHADEPNPGSYTHNLELACWRAALSPHAILDSLVPLIPAGCRHFKALHLRCCLLCGLQKAP